MVGTSIRWRITTISTVATVVVLIAVGALVVAVTWAQLLANLDRSLEQRADQIGAGASANDLARHRILANRDDEDRFAQIVDPDGRVVAATTNLQGRPAVAEVSASGGPAATRSDVPVEDDDYRVLVRPFEIGGRTRHVIVGENIDDLVDATRALVLALVVTFPVAAGLLGAGVWRLVGRTLEPVEAIRAEVSAIGLADLDHRVPEPGSDDEIGRLAATMNAMLARFQRSASQQRQFVADASHELRTPLTRLRMRLEVDRHRSDADLVETVDQALIDVASMQVLVEDLLFLARADAGRARRPPEPVDLDAVAQAEVGAVRGLTPVAVRLDAEPVVVAGHGQQLARLVGNLLSNAVRHAATEVRVDVGPWRLDPNPGGGHAARLVVEDDGRGIPAGERQRVLDRFVRLDTDRGSTTGGAGLGLAIVADIVALHDGSITIDGSPLGGARCTVLLPLRPTDSSS